MAPDEAAGWRAEADAVADALGELWDGERLAARSVSGQRRGSASSLLTAIPILAGGRLPTASVPALVAKVTSHLTEFGLATELIDSAHYASDGYWRGPIWAPSTRLIEAGLRTVGEYALADEVSARFRRLCEQSGFAENFDAVTGEGLRDRAYTWTASVYLLMADDASRRASERSAGLDA